MNNYCHYIETKHECKAWPELTKQTCKATLACADAILLGANHGARCRDRQTDGFHGTSPRPNFLCDWKVGGHFLPPSVNARTRRLKFHLD